MRKKDSLLYDAFMLYDLNGNRIRKTGERFGADGKMQELDTAYSYDCINRLTEERRVTDGDRYAYDLAGSRLKKQHYNYALTAEAGQNRHSNIGTINSAGYSSILDGEETYCYNERNELTEKKTLSVITKYLYDENGNLVREKEGDKTASYQYDLLSRQTYVKTLEGREQENFYDGEGLRAGISVSGKISTFIFHNGEILAECDENSIPVKRHLQGLGLSCVQTLNDDVYHAYHQDEQGSTVYITGNSGVAENSYAYDAFGNVLAGKVSIENRICYTGQQYDQETGQYYLRARFYNPVIGRFTQEDTYRGDGLNLYAYCANNPVIYYDPSGHGQKKYSLKSNELEKPKSASDSAEGSDLGNYTFKEGIDEDLRGGKDTFNEALDKAFENTGTPKDDFDVTKWGRDQYGKSHPVEWKASNGAEVNIDLGHSIDSQAPTSPHVGWQTGGKRGNGGAVRGHIFVDDVPYNR